MNNILIYKIINYFRKKNYFNIINFMSKYIGCQINNLLYNQNFCSKFLN